MPKLSKKEVKENFKALMNSCAEGFTGEWDPSGEGRDGFEAMYDQLQKLADHFRVDVTGVKELYPDDPCQSCRKLGETTCGNDTNKHSCYEGK